MERKHTAKKPPAGRPLVHPFRTGSGWYVYDVHTNEVVEVHPLVHEILGRLSSIPPEAVADTLDGRHPAGEIARAMAEIAGAQEEGLFLPRSAGRVTLPWSSRELQEAYRTGLEKLVLLVTDRCNFRCRYCIYDGRSPFHRPHGPRDMDRDLALKSIDYYMERSEEWARPEIIFVGGEPLSNFVLVRVCVSYVGERYPARPVGFALTTNGSLLSPAVADFLAGHDFNLTVSLNGPRDLHDRHCVFRNGRPAFSAVWRNLVHLRRSYPRYFERRVGFSCPAPPPAGDLDRIFDFFDRDPVPGVTPRTSLYLNPPASRHSPSRFMNRVAGSTGADEEENIEAFRQRHIRLEACGEAGKRPSPAHFFRGGVLRVHHRTADHLGHTVHPASTCIPGKSRLAVRTDGLLQPCEDGPEAFVIGNMHDGGIDTEKAMRMLRMLCEVIEGMCLDCWAQRLCSACLLKATNPETGEVEAGELRRYCASMRESADRALRG